MPNKLKQGLIFLCTCFLFIVLAACSDEPQPEETFNAYAEKWENENFSGMYEQLSAQTVENISAEEFIDRYETIYRDIEMSDLSIQRHYPEEWEMSDEEEVQFPIDVSMQTLAGEVAFSHDVQLVMEERDEEKNWYVHWDSQLIFPELEEDDLVGVQSMEPVRGEIVDRNGNGLAVNGTVLQVGMVPERMEGIEESSIRDLATELDISEDHIQSRLDQEWVNADSFVPVYVLPEEEQTYIEKVLMENIPGVTYLPTDSRVYPYAEAAAHLIGYIREITAEELEERTEEGYSAHDFIGVTGLESLFEEELKGESGGVIYTYESIDEEHNEQSSTDEKRKEIVAELEPTDGEDVHLTIDIELQEHIFDEFGEDTGTATAVHPTTGEVLALVNAPAYNPNLYVMGQGSEMHAQWEEDPERPLLNRFRYTFSPGSTFKHITAAVALENGTIHPDEAREIEGLEWQKDESWGDYAVKRVTDPGKPVDLRDALVFSDNIFFAQSALDMGGEAFTEGVLSFGFDEDIPFSYPIDSSTLREGDAFDDEIMLADSAYGQGQVQMSALHLTMTYTPLLNEGDMLIPVLLEDEVTEDGPEVWNEQVMSAEVADTILQSLIEVVEHPDGTGHEAQMSGRTVAGKTGTAELKDSPEDEDERQLGWFVGFDTEEADLLLTMMVEDVQERGGSGYVVLKVANIMGKY